MATQDPFKPPIMSLEQTRGRLTFLGVALLVLGVLAILAPIASTFVATMVIGVLLVVGGVLRLFHASEGRKRHNIVWLVFSSILYILAGLAVLWRPLIGTLSMTAVVGAFFVVSAVSKAIHAYQFKGTGTSGWLLVDAVISGLLGVLLLAGLPTTAFWALGVIVGVDLIMGGIALLALASPRDTVRSV
jgi:uncharacterized membrane protein HdeD (DUF308 family)